MHWGCGMNAFMNLETMPCTMTLIIFYPDVFCFSSEANKMYCGWGDDGKTIEIRDRVGFGEHVS